LLSSLNLARRFALVGKFDLDRDGKDDRDGLKRTMVEAGGIIVFDLPPPDVGKETGALSPRIDWYVIDDRMPLPKQPVPQTPLPNRVLAILREARLNGIRPMTIERLLSSLKRATIY
jgi:hypothetical protein